MAQFLYGHMEMNPRQAREVVRNKKLTPGFTWKPESYAFWKKLLLGASLFGLHFDLLGRGHVPSDMEPCGGFHISWEG